MIAGVLVHLLLQDAPPALPRRDPAPFVRNWFFRTMGGAGSAPDLPADDRSFDVVVTAEIGAHPLQGAFATGLSVSDTTDAAGHWSVVTPGLFGQIDLTYVFLSGLWAYAPPASFPFRLAIGSRLGMGVSESFRPNGLPAATYAPAYGLIRPELMSFFDVGVPLSFVDASSPFWRRYAVVARASVDTAINVSTLYRWSGSIGLAVAWGEVAE
jgi:hypothetical protein